VVHGDGDVTWFTGVAEIMAGSLSGCARRADGTAVGWGYSGQGNLGDHSTTR
jgi:hypothetical protein